MIASVTFEQPERVDPAEILAFYERQNHEAPHSLEKLERMIDNSFCIVTARKGGQVIGFARGTTDGLVGVLAECKLDPNFQGPACITRTDGRIEDDSEGIAKEMARRTIEALRAYGVERMTAVAYGTEVDFCEELGFKRRPGVAALALEFEGKAGTAAAKKGASAPA